jgi:chlorophyll(ide) b reductase
MLTQKQLNVVVTGGSRGFGKALVKTFAKDGHKVLFTSRKRDNVARTIHDLGMPHNAVGMVADVSRQADIDNIMYSVSRHMGDGIDIWVNNAAVSDGNTAFTQIGPIRVREIVDTNLYGTIMSCQAAIAVMSRQDNRMGHVFNVTGAGANGSITPDYGIYGCTKAAVSQLTRTLRAELSTTGAKVGIHTLSPGMMATDLLAENLCDNKRRIYNILCENPEVVAQQLLPQFKDIVKNKKMARDIHHMTPIKVLYKLLSAHERTDRFFT